MSARQRDQLAALRSNAFDRKGEAYVADGSTVVPQPTLWSRPTPVFWLFLG